VRAGTGTVDGRVPGVDRALVAVFADERDHLVVVDEDGLLHHKEATNGVKNGGWQSVWGLPSLSALRAPLRLPIPLASLRPGLIAYSQRHANVMFYEDRSGAQFHWGTAGCTSLWVLVDDDVRGSRLLFADPWIPADFSRELLGPNDGATRLVSVAASASMVAVLAKDGGVYVRFDDYDHNGGTPFFRYSYTPTTSTQRPGTDPASEVNVRGLPGFGWEKLPGLPDGARLSRLIGVAQTGTGNRAREVRVVGDDASGARGLWRLSLNDSEGWRFTVVDDVRAVAVSDDDWLVAHAEQREAPRRSYAGVVVVRGGRVGPQGPEASTRTVITVRTDDAWFHKERFTLTATVGGDDVVIDVGAVDAWTLFRGDNPVDRASAQKQWKLTLRVRDGSVKPEARAAIADWLGGNEGVPFAFAAVIDQGELVIQPAAPSFAAPRWRLIMRHDTSIRRASLPRASERAAAITGDAHRDRSRCRADSAVRDSAARALSDVDNAEVALRQEGAIANALAVALPLALAPIDALTVLTTARFTTDTAQYLVGLEQHLPAVLSSQALARERAMQRAADDVEETRTRLRACIGGQ